ncbi:hypothetical protein K501DRAFT_239057 [Backusella circina FSU 941]|nr:hypothetical protein K501DRAFT_239057 [Backusella circina FSU 941]
MDTRKSQLYKTELCRNWQDFGECRYAKKCRFAHGSEEQRCVQRHARYKTEICRTFHSTGTCLYGVRCNFVHDEVSRSPLLTGWDDMFKRDDSLSSSSSSSFIWSLDRRYSSSSSSISSLFS